MFHGDLIIVDLTGTEAQLIGRVAKEIFESICQNFKGKTVFFLLKLNTQVDAQLPQKSMLFQHESIISCSCVGVSKTSFCLQQTIELKTANKVPGSTLKAGFTLNECVLLLGLVGGSWGDNQRKC